MKIIPQVTAIPGFQTEMATKMQNLRTAALIISIYCEIITFPCQPMFIFTANNAVSCVMLAHMEDLFIYFLANIILGLHDISK